MKTIHKIFKTAVIFFIIALVFTACRKDDEPVPPQQPEAFTYNGASGMSTGITSIAGTTAPAGYTWSQLKLPQESYGSLANITGYILADDFTIPSGEKWTIQNFYFYAYETNFSGTAFPVNELYFEIYSSDPSAAGAVKVYGNLTTNRFVSAEDAKMYRIAEGQPDTTTRKIYKLKTQASDLILSAGTYWIKWGSKSTSSGNHFYPQFPNDPAKINNAMQYEVSTSTWKTLLAGGGQNLGFPLEIAGTKLPN